MHAQPELILNINKPLEWTSFDAVNRLKFYIKRNFPEHKNIKIGHAGTLDPLATGVLIVCIGKATKKIEQLQQTLKEYTGTIYVGATTPSYDLETAIDQHYDISHITAEQVQEVAASFTGVQQQMPPVFSAKKINGKRAYEMARQGKEVIMRPSEITIFSCEITRLELPEIDFRIVCSKGTYIRSIAADFGKRLQSGAHLSRLCRTASGDYRIENSLSPDECFEPIAAELGKFDSSKSPA